GSNGLLADDHSGSTGLTVANSVLFGNYYDGAYIGPGNDHATFSADTFRDQANGSGIDVRAAFAVLSGNVAYHNGYDGLTLSGAAAQVRGNRLYGNTEGIRVSGDGSTVAGNTVFDNTGNGILASGAISITGNTIYG